MEKKYRTRIWITAGVTVAILIGMVVAWGIFLVKPQNAELANAQTKYNDRKAVADKLPKALESQKKAEDEKIYLTGQLAFFRQRYRSLPFGDINGTSRIQLAAREVAWRRWMNEYFNDYGMALKSELVRAANATGVSINTSIKILAPPKAPEEVIVPANGLFRPTEKPLSLTVTGTMSGILQFLNRLNQSSILMVVDKDLKLEGASPEIKATFSVLPYLLASGSGVNLTATGGDAGAAAPGGGGAPGAPGMPAAPGAGGGPEAPPEAEPPA